MNVLEISVDEAYEIQSTVEPVNEEREKYHMRQLITFERDGKWWGFEYFDGLDKHMEGDFGDDYRDGDVVKCYEVEVKEIVTHEYQFKEKELEKYE